MDRVDKRHTTQNVIIAVLVTVFFVGIIFMYYNMLYNEKRENIIKEGEMVARDSVDQIDKYLATNVDSIKLAAYTLNGMIVEKRSDQEIQDYLLAQSTAIKSAVLENSTGLYAYINGRFFSGTGWVPPEGYDPTARPWYTKPMENPGELTILEPYVDVQSGNVMLALGKTLCDGVSVISVDVSLDRIQSLTEEAVASGDSDIEMVLNDKGEVVAHSDKNEIGKIYGGNDGSFGSLIASGLGDSAGHFEFSYQGSNYIAYTASLENGWHCISVKNATEVFGSLKIIFFATIALVILTVIIIAIFTSRSNRYLVMSERAIAANRAKSAFLSNMSHEIRTPINAVLGMNEMILRESGDPVILGYAENIKTAGKNLLGIINDILDFSKIEAGKIEIIPVDYDLTSVINDLVNMIRARAEEKGLLLTLDIDSDIPRFLNGDEIRIKQIITNLLINAVKYTETGSVGLSLGYKKTSHPDYILLAVTVNDTGIGIKEEDMEKLFSEFERIEENRNRHIEGTGLGMNITGGLLERMDSELKVSSVYGEGSTFSFELRQRVVKWDPVGDHEFTGAETHDGVKKSRESFTAPDARVLVVDDNPMNLMVFKNLVRRTGVKVDTAGNGNECILITGDVKYDVIFMDHMMPGKDGIETMHEIRKTPGNPNADTPMVCLTANAISGAREEYTSAGFEDFLTKPIDPDRLESVMMQFIPSEKVHRTEVGAESVTESEGEYTVLFSRLEQSGVDTASGIHNSGSEASYVELLRIFAGSMDEKEAELDRFIETGDIRNYTIKIHALKSTMGIIGAAALREKAQKLEDAGKRDDRDYILANHGDFIKGYRALRDPLSVIVEKDSGDRAVAEAADWIMEDFYKAVRIAADDMDCDRLESIFSEMDAYRIPADHEEIYKKLKAAAADYEYVEILSILSNI